MSDQYESTDADLIALENALKSLAPSRPQVDRDAIMFRAGRESARRGRRWMAAAASLAAVALGEAALLANRPAPQVVERIVVVRTAPPAPVLIPEKPHEAPVATVHRPTFGPGQTAHDRLTWQVLRYGLDGLPAPVKSAWTDREPRPESARQMLQDELRKILEPGDPS